MQVQTTHRDSRVREHFNATTELYVDVHRDIGKVICGERLALLHRVIGRPFDWPLRLLDIGCGGGMFSDMFLDRYYRAQSYALDSSEGMLRRNTPSKRKLLLLADARAMPFGGGRFDVINLDAVLHHVLDERGYQATIDNLVETLRGLNNQLAPGGVLIIREIYHEYRAYDALGTRLIHFVSTLTLPEFVASGLKKIGLKTANAGVCFLTRRQWAGVFARAGLRVADVYDKAWAPAWTRLLGFRRSGEMHYVLAPDVSDSIGGKENTCQS